jgi:hypothetical protein
MFWTPGQNESTTISKQAVQIKWEGEESLGNQKNTDILMVEQSTDQIN